MIDRINTCENDDEKTNLTELLDLLTPVIKAWPSEYGPKANDLGIQVLGGAGYTREYLAEQFWRDNRLNPIHEGTNGIQALDLTFRKLWQNNSLGLQTLQREIGRDLAQVSQGGDTLPQSRKLADKLMTYLDQLPKLVMQIGQEINTSPQKALALTGNAAAMMSVFATLIVSWMWLRQALTAETLLNDLDHSNDNTEEIRHFYQGKLQAAKYFMDWELPLIERDLALLRQSNEVVTEMQAEWF